jgi:hypothetical protein
VIVDIIRQKMKRDCNEWNVSSASGLSDGVNLFGEEHKLHK